MQMMLDTAMCDTRPQVVADKNATDHPDVVIGRDQIRMARIGMRWSAKELARRARLSVATIQRAESETARQITEGNLYLIQRAFEDAGVVFLDEDQMLGGGRGVRLPKDAPRV